MKYTQTLQPTPATNKNILSFRTARLAKTNFSLPGFFSTTYIHH